MLMRNFLVSSHVVLFRVVSFHLFCVVSFPSVPVHPAGHAGALSDEAGANAALTKHDSARIPARCCMMSVCDSDGPALSSLGSWRC